MAPLHLLTLDQLASILGRSPETIRKDLVRNSGAVPPRLVIPGTRLLRWRAVDVERWLEACSHVAGNNQ
ncbi:AlpA family transcriptional regulator [Hydrogenophaga sp.]|uniref:helix-turn-helix transcriptional regulator n=1 Tax=Hydrogenophaga sp. TaxID=1904254 RepID=UPI002721DE66|nr:helix-turn-helix domain-containing protein [Hydrogenophaga sp.]MDO8905960.1 helix-turn-helix domain-containing protein [Hydrogenophaga sp.]